MADAQLTPAQLQDAETRAAHEGYIHRVLVGFDQFWNVVFGGQPDETISSRVRRISDDSESKHKLLAVVLNHALNLFQANHGALAEAGDLERAQTVEATEKQALDAT